MNHICHWTEKQIKKVDVSSIGNRLAWSWYA